ncbi:MAG: hypothetical protein R2710_20900 [Acidimicrobiales bacterium]
MVATHEIAEIVVIANGLRFRRSIHGQANSHVATPEREVVHV